VKITNTYNLPAAIVTATSRYSQRRDTTPRRIRVTELIGPPQMRVLTHQHWDDIEEDVTDRVWALFGSAVHEILHQGNDANTLTEERLNLQVGDWTISGQSDLYEEDGTLSDWKVKSVWGIVYGDGGSEEQQVNVYAHILRAHGFSVNRLQIVAILRDWQQRKARMDKSYPQRPVNVRTVPLWDSATAQAFIEARLLLHSAAVDGQVPPCTSEERREKPTTYAVMKGTNKRAARVLNSDADARSWAMTNLKADEKFRMDVRPGENIRCQSYCRCLPWCAQGQALVAVGNELIDWVNAAHAIAATKGG